MKAAEVDDRIRSAAATTPPALIEAELSALIRAEPHERTDTRLAQRNGHRPRVLATTTGGPEQAIPKARVGSSTPRGWNGAGGCGALVPTRELRSPRIWTRRMSS